MNLVIDLQAAQTTTQLSPFGMMLPLLVRRLAQSKPQWRVHVVVNGLADAALSRLRRQLTQEQTSPQLHVWCAPGPLHWSQPQNRLRQVLGSHTRHALIASLKPDLIVFVGLYEGFVEDAVTGFCPVEVDKAPVPTVVLVPPLPVDIMSGSDAWRLFLQYQKQQMQHVAMCLLDPGADRDVFIHHFELSGERCQVAPYPLDRRLEESHQRELVQWFATQCSAVLDAHSPALSPTVTSPVRPRLACVAPLPPEKTGIATYVAELLPQLALWYDIEVITDQPLITDSWIQNNCQQRTVDEFSRAANSYDRVLYHIGNSHFHWSMFPLLEKYPGIVVLHDFYLGNTLEQLSLQQGNRQDFNNMIYRSHGFAALEAVCRTEDTQHAVWDFPCNLPVLHDALGIISHSEHSRQLAREFYPAGDLQNWWWIPLVRTIREVTDKEHARQRTTLPGHHFVVAAFGAITATKLNRELLQAWLASPLGRDETCQLVFVGEIDAGDYGETVQTMIADAVAHGSRITVTGWVDDQTYHAYMDAVDVAVQLRSRSRGESSGAVLDCMNHGLPVVANACGSMAELPADSVCLLPAEITAEGLGKAIESLWNNPALRRNLGDNARRFISREHAPQRCGQRYHEAIEACYRPEAQPLRQLLPDLARKSCMLSDDQVRRLAIDLAQTFPQSPSIATIYIDVTVTCRNQLNTGIERVATSLIRALVATPPPGYRIEPVYLNDLEGRAYLCHARRYTQDLLGIGGAPFLDDDAVAPKSGDLYLCPEISGDVLAQAIAAGIYSNLHKAGVAVTFILHDLLPLTLPDCFPVGADAAFERWLKNVCHVADGVVGVTRSVAESFCQWLATSSPHLPARPLTVGWSHHGADFITGDRADVATRQPQLQTVMSAVDTRPTFLMVGTVEPRKGYQLALDAFTLLWQQGCDSNLVIVGSEGWGQVPAGDRRELPQLVHNLRAHPELQKRLFWLQGLDDSTLQELYRKAGCLLGLSRGEGFGLPLIEAASHGVSLLVRDLPVFREVAGGYADYIGGETPAEIATAITGWLTKQDGRSSVPSQSLPHLSWQQSAARLVALMTGQHQETVESVHLYPVFSGIYKHLPRRRKPHLFVDVSVVCRQDYRTGIQRTTRALYLQLIGQTEKSHAVVPVSFDPAATCYRVAAGFLEHDRQSCAACYESDAITPEYGDIFLGLDLAGQYVVQACEEQLFQRYRQAGARVLFVVYDLLPITWPQFFRSDVAPFHQRWLQAVASNDGALCISATVADELRTWLNGQRRWPPHHFEINWFHLGADPENSAPTIDMPVAADQVLAELASGITFLMVGTVEPRKGYFQTLQAFDILWRDDPQAKLVIVGRVGWMMESFEEVVKQHPRRGNQLFRLEGVSDTYLECLYATADCLVAASKDEGFGLPLIEAAQHGVPLLVRDIPVFREVAGDHAAYFADRDDPEILALALKNWLDAHRRGEHPRSDAMPWLTWQQSAAMLQECLNQ